MKKNPLIYRLHRYDGHMSSSQNYAHYIQHDLLGFMQGITSKRMFGGWGFYLHGNIFSFIIDDELYFKTSPEIEPEFASRGSEQFIYDGHTSK